MKSCLGMIVWTFLCLGLAGCDSTTVQKQDHVHPARQTIQAHVPPGVTDPAAEPVVEDPYAKALWELSSATSNSNRQGSRMQQGMRALREQLPEFKVTTGDALLQWNSITLPGLPPENGSERRFAAFRFRSPLSEPADLHWVYAVPEETGRWYILPLEGQMPGFRSFKSDWNLDIPGLKLPRGNSVIFQELLGGEIRPGVEYVIWYAPADQSPNDFHAGLRLTPAGTHAAAASLQELAHNVGVPLQYQSFEKTPVGLREAFELARTIVRRDGDTDAFRAVLDSVWDIVPAAQPTLDAAQPVWNTLTTDIDPRFHVVRIRCELEDAADLQVGIVVEDNVVQFDLSGAPYREPNNNNYQIPADRALNYHLQLDCPVPEDVHVSSNLTLLHCFQNRQFQKDKEYLLWFAPERALLPDIKLTYRFTAAGSVPEKATPHEIGLALGLDVPDVPSPERVAKALKLIQRLEWKTSTEPPEFTKLLDFIRPGVPILESSETETVWTHVALGTKSDSAVAYRIPLTEGNHHFWVAVARPQSPRIYVSAFFPYEKHLSAVASLEKENVQFEGVKWPWKNSVLQCIKHPWNSDRSHALLLLTPTSVEATSCLIATRASTINQEAWEPTLSSLCQELHLQLPGEKDPGGLLGKHQDKISTVRYLGDSDVIFSGSFNQMKTWSRTSKQELQASEQLEYGGRFYAFGPDFRTVAVSRGYWEVSLFDVESLQQSSSIPLPSEQTTSAVAFSPEGSMLVGMNSRESQLWRWRWPDKSNRDTHEIPDFQLHGMRWHPNGKLLIVLGLAINRGPENRVIDSNGIIRFLDPETWATVHELRVANCRWTGTAISTDGRRLAAVSNYGEIFLWDLNSFKPINAIHPDNFESPIFLNADGSLLLCRTESQQLQFWDVNENRLIQTLPLTKAYASTFALRADGKELLLGGEDGGVRLIDVPPAPPPATPTPTPNIVTNSLGMQLIIVPNTEFEMGTPDNTRPLLGSRGSLEPERPAHHVKFSKPYALGMHEVTVGQFRQFVKATGYKTTAESSGKGGEHLRIGESRARMEPGWNWMNPGFPQEDNHPVVHISWHDAVAFCHWLTDRENQRYRLPTEAEWEMACRAGTTTDWSFGNKGETSIVRYGNIADAEARAVYKRFDGAVFASDGYAYTSPVGSLRPNPWGFYDLHGNVFEWCHDYYDAVYYHYSAASDPSGGKNGSHRVQRGGGFFSQAADSRSAYRESGPPDQVQSSLGFRVLRELP